MNFVHFIQLILVLTILIAVGVPLFRGLSKLKLFAQLDRPAKNTSTCWFVKRRFSFRSKDLEFDWKTHKVSEQDHQKQRKKLEEEAVAILEQLDVLEKEKKKGKKSTHPASRV